MKVVGRVTCIFCVMSIFLTCFCFMFSTVLYLTKTNQHYMHTATLLQTLGSNNAVSANDV